MHDIGLAVASPEAADCGIAELWTAEEPSGYIGLAETELMLRIDAGYLHCGRRLRAQPRAGHRHAERRRARTLERQRTRRAPRELPGACRALTVLPGV